MNYGLYLSTSGMLTSMYRMDVVASNLANAETPGYKTIVPTTRQRDAASVEDGLPFLPSDRMLERLGGGPALAPNRLVLSQGVPQETGRSLDICLDGKGFLVVSAGNPDTPKAVRFTRDGRLAVNDKGVLVQAASGRPVLDRGNQIIELRRDLEVEIDPSGTVLQKGDQRGRLQISTIADPSTLRPVGEGLLAGPATPMERRTDAVAQVMQGWVEGSGVDPVTTLVDFTTAERAVGANSRMLQLHDQLLDRAINGLGKLA